MSRIGRYEIVSELGRGGMGIVYLAQDTLLDRQVAIKSILPPKNTDQGVWVDTVRRFIREARAAASLNHPNLVATYDVISDGDSASIVMEYVKGKTIAQTVPLGRRPEIEFTLKVLRQCASGLDHAHSRGIVHRDVKPENIILDEAGSVKITDFGIAKQLNASTHPTQSGFVLGTLEYMAPEQLDSRPVESATDQYALAVIAYRVLTGSRIFDADSLGSWCAKVLLEPIVPASRRHSGLPSAVDEVFARAMEKKPASRYGSCSHFVAELERALGGSLLHPKLLETVGLIPQNDPGLQPDSEFTQTINVPIAVSTQARAWRRFANSRKYVGVAVGTLVLFVAGWFTFNGVRRQASTIPVSIFSQDGVTVQVGGKQCVTPHCALTLEPGAYQLSAAKDGYEPVKQELLLKPGQAAIATSLALAPLPEILQVNTNFPSGTVLLDSRRVGDLVNGSFLISRVLPGRHLLEVKGGGTDFQARWLSESGSAPTLPGIIEAKDLAATVVSSVGTRGRIISNQGSRPVKIDGSAVGSTTGSGTSVMAPEISLVGDGVRNLEIGSQSTFLEVHRNPALSVFLTLDRNVGTLFVETRPGEAKVFLNGRFYGQTTATGVLRAPIDTGRYSVRAVKDGFQASDTRYVDLAKGQEQKLTFTLTRVPAILNLSGLTPGDEVRIDGRSRGLAGPSQSMRLEDLPAGPHNLELVRDGYNPGRSSFQLTDGEIFNLDASHITLARKETAPPPPDAAAIEARDWDRVRNSNSLDALQDFLNRHASGAHTEQVRSRINQLRQSQAKEAEENAWKAADTKASLLSFIQRYGNSPHIQEARNRLNEIARQEAEELAARNALEQNSRDQAAIRQTLARFEAAFAEMDAVKLQQVWGGSPDQMARFKDEFKAAKAVAYQLRSIEVPAINGDSATVSCTRTLKFVPKSGAAKDPPPDRVRVTLARSGSTWLIRAIAAF